MAVVVQISQTQIGDSLGFDIRVLFEGEESKNQAESFFEKKEDIKNDVLKIFTIQEGESQT